MQSKDLPIGSLPRALHPSSLPQYRAPHGEERNESTIVCASVGRQSVQRRADGESPDEGTFHSMSRSELTAPFRMVVESGDQWVQHGIETVLGLAFYGLGLGFLARYSRV